MSSSPSLLFASVSWQQQQCYYSSSAAKTTLPTVLLQRNSIFRINPFELILDTHLCMLTLLTVSVTENGSEVIRKLYLLHNKAITRTESYSFHGPRWPQQLDDVLWGTSNVCRLVTKIIGNCWMPRSRRWIWMTLFQEDPPAGVSGAPTENNIMLWNAVIFGPHETPFEVRPDPTNTPHHSLAYHNT